ncbi:MAG: cell division protein ZapA, partial [Rhodospirillales bacterium]|nr:cell division protein ZapA [Rhodospirillales bacterium]
MAQLTVSINGRNYQVACDDGQEAHLSRLGTYVDNRVKELVAAVGQVGDA